jgi:hypothetical protein
MQLPPGVRICKPQNDTQQMCNSLLLVGNVASTVLCCHLWIRNGYIQQRWGGLKRSQIVTNCNHHWNSTISLQWNDSNNLILRPTTFSIYVGCLITKPHHLCQRSATVKLLWATLTVHIYLQRTAKENNNDVVNTFPNLLYPSSSWSAFSVFCLLVHSKPSLAFSIHLLCLPRHLFSNSFLIF